MDCIVHRVAKSQTPLSPFDTQPSLHIPRGAAHPPSPNLCLLAYHGLAKLAVSCFLLHSEQMFFLQKSLLQTS